MTKEEYLKKVAEMQTDISAIKQEGAANTKTCKNCIHQAVCYRYSYGLPENYADKCGDYLPQKSGKWIIDRKVIDKSRKPTTYQLDVHCSECGFKYAYTTDKEDSIPTNYCPNCGAKMERSDKE